jgi:hypothetical protein
VPKPLNEALRNTMHRIAKEQSEVSVSVRAKKAYTGLEQSSPELVKDYPFKRFFQYILAVRHTLRHAKKKRRTKVAKKALRVRRPADPVSVFARKRGLDAVVEVITFLEVNAGVIAQYEQLQRKHSDVIKQYQHIKKSLSPGLQITFSQGRPILTLKK